MEDDTDIEINLSDQVKEAMAKDPALAAEMRAMFADMRTVMHGLKTGKYRSFDEGFEKLTGERPTRIEEDDGA